MSTNDSWPRGPLNAIKFCGRPYFVMFEDVVKFETIGTRQVSKQAYFWKFKVYTCFKLLATSYKAYS